MEGRLGVEALLKSSMEAGRLSTVSAAQPFAGNIAAYKSVVVEEYIACL